MKKLLVTATFVFIFFSQPLISFAQTAAPSRTPKGVQVRQEVKLRIAEEKTEREAKLSEQRKARITAFFERMMKRFEAAIERLELLIDRIQARINKIEEENSDADTSSQQGQLDGAKSKLDDAKGKIQTLKDEFDTFLNSDDPKIVFKEVGDNVRDLKQDLVEIHRILVQIIGDIKGLRIGNEKI